MKALVFRQSVCHLTKETLSVNARVLARFWSYIIGMWDMLPRPYVAIIQTTSFCKSVNIVVQSGVFRDSGGNFILCPLYFVLLYLPDFLCFPELSLIACTEGEYLSSVSEFQLTWKNLDLPKLLVLPINEMGCFPMLVKNLSNENGINTWNNVVNCSVHFFLTRLGRIVELLIFTKKNPINYFSFRFYCIFHIWSSYGKS